MRFLWDAIKRLANLDKHGLDFADVASDFDWTTANLNPARGNRVKAIGRLHDLVVVVIFAPLGSEAVSIVSLRSASARERMDYAKTRKEL